MEKSLDTIKIEYLKNMKPAISLVVCNYAGLNQAIEMGLDRENNNGDQSHIELSNKAKMQELCEQVGGPILRKASPVDLTKRILLIDAILELMMEDKVDAHDVEELVDQYMWGNFTTNQEDDDHQEMGEILIEVRTQLIDCAHNDKDMSKIPKLLELIEFNDKNRGQLDEIEKLAKQQQMDL